MFPWAAVNDFKYARSQVDDGLLTIGELSARTGVPTSALRYYDERGLVRPVARRSGQRRYDAAAVDRVGVVLFLRDVGFTLGEVGQLVSGRQEGEPGWRDIAKGKLAELNERASRLRVARVALEHAIRCRHGDPAECPTFWSIVSARLDGRSLAESHRRADVATAEAPVANR